MELTELPPETDEPVLVVFVPLLPPDAGAGVLVAATVVGVDVAAGLPPQPAGGVEGPFVTVNGTAEVRFEVPPTRVMA